MPWIIIFLLGLLHSASFAAPHLSGWLTSIIQLVSFASLTVIILNSHSAKCAFLKAWVFGCASFCASLHWLYISMHYYGYMPSWLAGLAVLLFSVYLSFYLALAAAFLKYMQRSHILNNTFRGIIVRSLVWAAIVTLAELGRGYIFTGFPWNGIAYAHLDSTLSAFAPIGGAYSVTFAATFSSALLASMVLSYQDKHMLWRLGACVASVMFLGFCLNFVNWSTPSGKPIPVRLVQGNTDLQTKFDPSTMASSLQRQLDLAAPPVSDPNNNPKVVIFPETVIPAFQNQLSPEIWAYIIQQSTVSHATYFIGAPLVTLDNQKQRRITNSILYINWQTAINQFYESTNPRSYDKKHLVPFGEFIPYGFRWFVNTMNIPLGDFNRGNFNQLNFIVDDQVFSPNICYEDIFGEEILPALFDQNNNLGATILFNVSNLAWFGDSIALSQHFQQARMRALETSRPMLRATNTGITAYINQHGRIVAQLPSGQEGILDVSVQGTKGFTWYARTGNLPIFLLCLLIILLIKLRRQPV